MSATALLNQPLTFPRCGKVAPTRTLKSAMTERLCTYDQDKHEERGKPTPEYVHLYEEWGKGAIGVIVTGNIPVQREHLEAAKNAIIDPRSEKAWDPVEAFKPMIAASKAEGSLLIGQLTHGGRQVSIDVNPNPVSSSDVACPPAFGMTFGKPRPLTVEEIDELVKAFGYAAKKLHEAGADGVQFHAAHGYLLSQFLSANINTRTDSYGGSLENRARILFRIFDEVKSQVPDDFILSIKINSADFGEGGLTLEESRKVCMWLDERGIDLIELSGGTYETELMFSHEEKRESTKKREAYFVEFSEAIKPFIKNALLVVTGGFRTKAGMEDALQTKACDLIGLARPLCGEPQLIKEMIEGKKDKAAVLKVPAPLQIPATVAQMHAVARGEPVPDLSTDEGAQACLKSLGLA